MNQLKAITVLFFFTFLSIFSQNDKPENNLVSKIATQKEKLTSIEKELIITQEFLRQLEKSDPKNRLILIKKKEVDVLKIKTLQIKSNLYELIKDKKVQKYSFFKNLNAEEKKDIDDIQRNIDYKYTLHEQNQESKGQFKNTKITYAATILNTNFSIPIARFNFAKKEDLKQGNVQMFNSIGAGFGCSWGRMTDYRDENGELENSSFANTVSIHIGFLFSAGSENNNVFAPVLTFGVLDFQLGIGMELGDLSENQKREFITIGYAIPLYKLVKGKYWFCEKAKIINEIKFSQ